MRLSHGFPWPQPEVPLEEGLYAKLYDTFYILECVNVYTWIDDAIEEQLEIGVPL